MKDFSDKYLNFLQTELAGINLTRITDEDEFYHKQIIDSVYPFENSKIFQEKVAKCKRLVDIGFGGGFPILPLASILPEVSFLGMEARGKKATAVSKIAQHLGLSNVTLMHQRFEEIHFDVPTVVTFKAVSTVENLLPKFQATAPIYAFFYKGPNFHELEDLKKVKKQWNIIEEQVFDIKHTDGRLLIGFEFVPRGTKKISDSKIKLSELF